jgi:hypothetical protein
MDMEDIDGAETADEGSVWEYERTQSTRDVVAKYNQHAQQASLEPIEAEGESDADSSEADSIMDSLRDAGLGITCRSFERNLQHLLPQRGLSLKLNLLPTVVFDDALTKPLCMFTTDARGFVVSLSDDDLDFRTIRDEMIRRWSPSTETAAKTPRSQEHSHDRFCIAHYRANASSLLTRAQFEVLSAHSGFNDVATPSKLKRSEAEEKVELRPWVLQGYREPQGDVRYLVTYTVDPRDDVRGWALPGEAQLSASCEVRCRTKPSKDWSTTPSVFVRGASCLSLALSRRDCARL